MFGRYREVFRTPGSAAFCGASFVMRMPIAMYPIAIVLIISARDGRYGFAGVLSACYTIGGAVGMPATSALVDRLGQRRVLIPAALVHAAAVVALALLVRTGAPDAVLAVPAVVFGVAYLSVGSLVRARWTHVLGGRPELSTAMSVESVLDELIFTVGPLIATLLATKTVPVSVLYVALALVVVGSVWLAALPSSAPPILPRDGERSGPALRAPGMTLLTVVTLPMGAVFASAEVAAIAFCGQHGHRGLSGFAVAAIAVGSGLSGLVYGARVPRGSLRGRFRVQALVFAALPFALLGAVNVPTLVVADLVLGLGIAPLLVAAFALVQQLVPARSLTEGLAWVTTGLSAGYGIGSALVGGVADAHGARTAFWVVIGCAVLVGLLGLVLYSRLGSSTAAEPDRPTVPRWDDAALP